MLIIILMAPLVGISSEKMKCEIYNKTDNGVELIARCENSVKICYVFVDGWLKCKTKG